MTHWPADPGHTAPPWYAPPERVMVIDGGGDHQDGCTCEGCVPEFPPPSPSTPAEPAPPSSPSPTPSLPAAATPALPPTPTPAPSPADFAEQFLNQVGEPLGVTSFELDARYPYAKTPDGACESCHRPPCKPGSPYCIYCLTLENLRKKSELNSLATELDALAKAVTAPAAKTPPPIPPWLRNAAFIALTLYILIVVMGSLH